MFARFHRLWGYFFVFIFAEAGLVLSAGAMEEIPSIPAYGLFQTAFAVDLNFSNAYDSSAIQVDAEIHSNDGDTFIVPCFYDGKQDWILRFTPSKPGTYTYRVTAKTPSTAIEAATGSFHVVENSARGFVRVSKEVPRFFVFENGESYFPLGENLGWVSGNGSRLAVWISYLDECQEAGINWIRIWMCPWGMTELVWKDDGKNYHGLEQYSSTNAEMIDGIFQAAEERGIYIQWVINHHGQYSINTNPVWNDNPYNAKNGGFLEAPEDFFTSEEAKRHYRDRLRYLVARWGYSAHLLAWEFWNEVDLTANFNFPNVRAWHEEMAAYLDSLDPYKHLRTTSASSRESLTHQIGGLDYLQTHAYVNAIIDRVMASSAQAEVNYPEKPHFFGEMSYNYRGPNRDDREGVILHNQLWASAHSPDSGTAMTWWWDNWVRPYNLYGHFKRLADYLEGIDWVKEKPVIMTALIEPAPANLGPFQFSPRIDWGETLRQEFTIKDGAVEYLDECTAFIHGRYHRDMAPNPMFLLETETATQFGFQIETLARAGSNCTVILDGTTIFSKNFPTTSSDTSPGGEGRIEFPLPPGAHRIEIRNNGLDWFKVQRYWIDDFVQRPKAYARGSENRILIWIHDDPHQFSQIERYTQYDPIQPVTLTLPEIQDGRYEVEQYDPYTGEITTKDPISASAVGLQFEIPSFLRDTAFRLYKSKSAVPGAFQRERRR